MEHNKENITYFLYRRKSTESAERQALSLDSQRDEAITKFGNLTIIELPPESVSAFAPYKRPIFADMIERINKGEAQGIVAWHPDRLSRNPIDGAQIIYMLDTGAIKDLKFCSYHFDNSPEGKMMLQIALSQSKYSSDKLSVDVTRGLEKKVALGWYPSRARAGYLNTITEVRGHNYIVKDPERFRIIRRAWDLMLTSNYTPEEVVDTLNNEWGFRTRETKTRGGKPLARSAIYEMFTDPFYMGKFVYRDVLYDGKHDPMVTHDEFDKVQVLLGRDGRPRYKKHKYSYPGLIRCGDCGGPVSATHKEKIMRSTGELKAYTLYYCVNARKHRCPCSQGLYTNVSRIEEQIDDVISGFTTLPEFKDYALEVLADEKDAEVEDRTKIYEMQQKAIDDTKKQLGNLTRMRIRELVDDEEYLGEKNRLKDEIKRIRKNMKDTEEKAEGNWLSCTEAFEFACDARNAFANGDVEKRRAILSRMSLNRTLKDHQLRIKAVEWLVPITEQYPSIERKMREFELVNCDKKSLNKRQREALISLRPLVRALVDAVGTGLIKEAALGRK